MAGGVAIVANWLLLFSAYAGASISIATAVYNTQPFMLVALGAIFLRERLTLAKLGWLLLSFGGMLLIVQARPGAGRRTATTWSASCSALGAAFFYALAAIFAKQLEGTPPHLIALIHVIVGTVVLLPMALSSDLPSGLVPWATLTTMGVVHTGLMYILLYGAIQKLPTHLTGALSFIYPIVAILVDRVAVRPPAAPGTAGRGDADPAGRRRHDPGLAMAQAGGTGGGQVLNVRRRLARRCGPAPRARPATAPAWPPARFSRRWLTDEVPGISRILGDWCSSQASATCIGVAPSAPAISASAVDWIGETHPAGKTARRQCPAAPDRRSALRLAGARGCTGSARRQSQ